MRCVSGGEKASVFVCLCCGRLGGSSDGELFF